MYISVTQSLRKKLSLFTSGIMTRVSLGFPCSVLFLALFVTSHTSAKPAEKSTNGTSGPIDTQKCNNVYFYEAPNSKIESMLQKVQKQLAQMQNDINIIKGKKNATKGNTVFSPSCSIIFFKVSSTHKKHHLHSLQSIQAQNLKT